MYSAVHARACKVCTLWKKIGKPLRLNHKKFYESLIIMSYGQINLRKKTRHLPLLLVAMKSAYVHVHVPQHLVQKVFIDPKYTL